MGICVLGFGNLFLIWQISFSEYVLRVHLANLKRCMNVKVYIPVLTSFLN